MNTSRSLTGRAPAQLRLPARYAGLVLAAVGAFSAACGSSDRSGLFGSPDEEPRPRGTGTGGRSSVGFAGASGSIGPNGAAGASDPGAGGSGEGGIGAVGGGSGAGAPGTGATNGNAGTPGVADGGGAGGSQGVGGAGGSPSAGGASAGGVTGGGGDGGDDAGAPDRPPCVTKPSQTVLIGDSYVNWATHTFQADLKREAGETWRMYAMGGASMATGGIATLIPDQFETGVRADKDIRVAVMDGGGNDVLVPAATWIGGGNCKNRADSPNVTVCQQIVQASLTREQVLMKRMADVGVRDVVFFFYPTVPNNTLLGGTNPNAIASWALPKVKAGCDDAYENTGHRLRCHFVDMVPVFQGHPEYFATGDIHPNTSGSAAMAKAVWDTMTSACVGQKAGSGCCQP